MSVGIGIWKGVGGVIHSFTIKDNSKWMIKLVSQTDRRTTDNSNSRVASQLKTAVIYSLKLCCVGWLQITF